MVGRLKPMAEKLNPLQGDTTLDREVLQRFAGELGRTVSSMLSARLGRNVTCTRLHPTPVEDEALPLPAVMWKIPFTGGLSGSAVMLFQISDANGLAHLLVGEEIRSEILSPEGEAALRDVVNEVAGSLAASLGDVCGRPVGWDPPVVGLVREGGELQATTTEAVRTEFEVEGVGRSDGLVFLESTLLRQLYAILSPQGSGNPFPLPLTDPTPRQPQGIDFLLDVPLLVTVELGRVRMPVREILHLVPGSVVELDKVVGDPVDILVNDTLIARGEVVVMGESFGIRLSHIVSQTDRIPNLRPKVDGSAT
ncbi:MAG: flagellar motor switch protein FliN [Candidatus Methylomirabilales bacterium]